MQETEKQKQKNTVILYIIGYDKKGMQTIHTLNIY